MKSRSLIGIMAATIALTCAGCGIPTSESATPFNASPDASNCTGPKGIEIYLVATVGGVDRLKAVNRPHVAKNGDAAPCAMNALNAGPTADEAISGLMTAFLGIPEDLGYLGTTNGVATVQLDAEFLSIAQPERIYEAFGQIVYTLTGLGDGINTVQFMFDNAPYPGVLLPNGSTELSGRVTRENYCEIGPPGQGCASFRTGTKATVTPGSGRAR